MGVKATALPLQDPRPLRCLIVIPAKAGIQCVNQTRFRIPAFAPCLDSRFRGNDSYGYLANASCGNQVAICGKWINSPVITIIEMKNGIVPWNTSLMVPSPRTPWIT